MTTNAHIEAIREHLAALEAQLGEPDEPAWMRYARAELGVREVPGSLHHNPRILEYHATTGLSAQDDETAWCASFVGWALGKAGIEGTSSAAARSYEHWGQRLDEPRKGCVVVLWRKRPMSASGHVAFYDGADGSDIKLLGGNQGNSVSVRSYPRDRVLSYRWP